jgi:ribosomal protein L24
MMIAGKDKGKTGIVSKVYKNRNQLIVDGINQVNKFNFQK